MQVEPTSGVIGVSGTVLVMDDEDFIRETITAMLESVGYSVIPAEDGKQALDKLDIELKAGRSLSAMIVDLTIPGGLGGMQMISEVRKRDHSLPVFVASGYSADPVMTKPEDFGFTASLCKPFRMVELLDLLRRHVKSI